MQFELFINFDGNCREAVEFYAKVFKSEVKNLMTYGQSPADPNYPMAEEDNDRVCYSDVRIGDKNIMFSDFPSNSQFIAGNNINPTLSMSDKHEVERVFNELKYGGEVYMELQQTFFSELYGMLMDKYGVVWMIMYYLPD
ncbi:MAG: VOC family protein [Tannerella sp.]|jgi:PhnB protein|nr:VOC family protein [Tannerella sp.]